MLHSSYTSQSQRNPLCQLEKIQALALCGFLHKHHSSLPPARLREVWPKNAILGLASRTAHHGWQYVLPKQFRTSGYRTGRKVLSKEVFLWSRAIVPSVSHVPHGLQSRKDASCLWGEEEKPASVAINDCGFHRLKVENGRKRVSWSSCTPG